MRRGRMVEDVLVDRFARENVRREYLVNGGRVYLFVFDGHVARNEHSDDGLAAATTGATGPSEGDVFSAGRFDVLPELFENLVRAGRVLTGRRADLDPDRARILGRADNPSRFLCQRGVAVHHRSRH